MTDQRHLDAASARTPGRRLIQELPINVLYVWLCESLASPSACAAQQVRHFPLALSTRLVHTVLDEEAARGQRAELLLTRPRVADILHQTLVHQLARLASVPSPPPPPAQESHATALREWAHVLSLHVPLPHVTHDSLGKMVDTFVNGSAPFVHGVLEDHSARCPTPLVPIPQRLLCESSDGQARRVLVFTALLGLVLDPPPHASLPWPAHTLAGAEMSRTLAALFPITWSTGCAAGRLSSRDVAGRTLPSLLFQATSVHRARVQTRQVLKQMLCRGAVELRTISPHSSADAPAAWADWLEWLDAETMASLSAQGATHALRGLPETTPPTDSSREPLWWLRGAIHHILGTVLDTRAQPILGSLLFTFLTRSVPTSGEARPDQDGTSVPPRPADVTESVSHRLRLLARHPEMAFLTSQTSTALQARTAASSSAVLDDPVHGTSSTSRSTSVLGPLAASHVVSSSSVHLLPCSTASTATEAGSGIPAFYWSSPSLLRQDGGPRPADPPPDRTVSQSPLPHTTHQREQCRHVLLLRIDPEGDWLPPAESTANTQTFFTYYANDNHLASGSRSPDSENEEGRFAVLESRQAGLRHVGAPHATDASDALDPADEQRHLSPLLRRTEALVRTAWSRLQARAGGDDPMRTTSPTTAFAHLPRPPELPSWADPQTVQATLRLYVYALLLSQSAASASPHTAATTEEQETLEAIITPERVPAFMKVFGLRHGAWLRQLVAQAPEQPAHQACALKAAGGPIYIVDEALLEYFDLLQTRVRRRHGEAGAVSSTPVVLCRDHLRQPAHPEEALVRILHVSTTTAAQLFDTAPSIGRASPRDTTTLDAYMSRPHLFFRTRAEDTAGHDTHTSVLPGFRRQQQSQRLCLLRLADHQYNGDSLCPSREPASAAHATARIVLVAPSPGTAMTYEAALRRTAKTLLSVYASAEPQRCVLVRGGGAYLIAAAAHLRRASDALAGFSSADRELPDTVEVRLQTPCGPSIDGRAPARRCLAWLWRLLSTALLSVPLHLWEAKARERRRLAAVSTRWATTAPDLAETRRRALWALDVAAAMRRCSGGVSGESTSLPPVSSVVVELYPPDVLIAQLLSSSGAQPTPCAAAEAYPLVEPAEPNRYAIRGALELLLATLTVSAT